MPWNHEEICKIAIELELREKLYVNLGIGIPTNIPQYLPKNIDIIVHSENGMLGIGDFPNIGEEDADLINAGKETITSIPETSYFDSTTSFAMIRGGYIDLSILGAMQVSANGDLANWCIPDKLIKGMGGAMDLVSNVKRVVILMDHLTKDGKSKLVKKCNLPLTGIKVVDRVITNLGVFDINDGIITLIKKADDITVNEIKIKTDCNFLTRF